MKKLFISPDITIKKALKILSQTGEKCLVVTNEKNKLLGTLSDGDVRKAILKGASIDGFITEFYQTKPIYLVNGVNKFEEAKNIFINEAPIKSASAITN